MSGANAAFNFLFVTDCLEIEIIKNINFSLLELSNIF